MRLNKSLVFFTLTILLHSNVYASYQPPMAGQSNANTSQPSEANSNNDASNNIFKSILNYLEPPLPMLTTQSPEIVNFCNANPDNNALSSVFDQLTSWYNDSTITKSGWNNNVCHLTATKPIVVGGKSSLLKIDCLIQKTTLISFINSFRQFLNDKRGRRDPKITGTEAAFQQQMGIYMQQCKFYLNGKLENFNAPVSKPMLPNQIPVYVKVVQDNSQTQTYKKMMIPTNNDYTGNPGCYIICYSRNSQGAIYPVNKRFYVMGTVRVQGGYDETHLCVPSDSSNQTLSKMDKYKNLCNNIFSACNNGCWAGGR